MDSVQLRDLLTPTVVIFVVSTAGQGEMPQNARSFWKALLSSALQPGVLRKVRFASFGLGDSSYSRYNTAHRMLHARMLHLGAKTFAERGEGNEQHPEGHHAGLREWIVTLKERLLYASPLPSGLEPLPEDAFLEPNWRLVRAANLNGGATEPNVHPVSYSVNATRPNDTSKDIVNPHRPQHMKIASPLLPSQGVLPVKESFTAEIIANDRMTAAHHFQDVRLLELRLDYPHDYGPGAVAVVYPKNFPMDVQTFIELMAWQDVCDETLYLVPNTSTSSSPSAATSPLHHFDLSDTKMSLRWLLESALDIMSIPRRSFFSALSHFATTNTDESKYQKERLLELADPNLIDELWDYTTRPKRTILEVMMDFTTVKIPWQHALTTLPIMRGRQFSIASGGKLKLAPDTGGAKIQLLVAVADPPSPIIKWRRRYGVCTRYIATLEAGQSINIGLQPGYLNVRPSDISVPVVMIGPGTGLAPMRALIYQRLVWAEKAELESRPAGNRLQGDILIFGCRAEHSDYYFAREWEELTRTEGLTVWTAFSRDPTRPKQYVQDQVRAHGKQVYERLMVQRGIVYVCGSSGGMPKGVRKALEDIVVTEGKFSEDEAAKAVDEWEKEGRYLQETW